MKELEKEIYQILDERGWTELRPADLAKSIMIEGAELLEHFQWSGDSLEQVKGWPEEKKAAIAKELADVMIYCIETTVLMGFDTKQIIRDKLAHNARKYPAEVVRAWRAKGNGSAGTDSEYQRIKNEYRAKEAAKKS